MSGTPYSILPPPVTGEPGGASATTSVASVGLADTVFNADAGPHLCAGFVDFNAVAVVPEFAGLVRYYRRHGVFGTLALLYNAGPAEFAAAIAEGTCVDGPYVDVEPTDPLRLTASDGDSRRASRGGRSA
jgi:hypothetical protein